MVWSSFKAVFRIWPAGVVGEVLGVDGGVVVLVDVVHVHDDY